MRPRRQDANHSAIRAAFRKRGCSWLDLYMVGKGCPDGMVGSQGKNILVEIKDGEKPPSERRLTKDEQAFFDTWLGQVTVVMSDEDVEAVVKALRE